jgi:ABC-type transport system substrate-binding protein
MKKLTIVLIVAIAASTALAAMPAFPAERTETATPGVSIVGGSDINLVSRQSSFPVVVNNSLGGDVQVIVHLASGNPKIIVEQKTVQLEIPADSTMNAQFPISAISSGDVVMVAWLTSLSGIELGPKVAMKLTVNPDIETWAIVLFLSLVAVLIVVGLIRTARRSRTS